ncbi:hypothetical protein [Robiginitomaculum antarcticum]|uniref:hypothetical protein n=1 Tax=Robiginitomaculum antarcticum TaxID=437507 RepID=UPI000365A1A7|nr:hypothetical protein [Robiginitomaculum antarcticum]
MIRYFCVIGAAAFLAACGSQEPQVPEAPVKPGTIQAPATPSVSNSAELSRDDFNPKFASWLELELGMDIDTAEPIIRERFGDDIQEEGQLSFTIERIYSANGRTVILATQEGALDDSISAQQLYAEFIPDSPLTNKLEFFGLRHKCRRGDNPGQWTTQLCP